MQVLRPLLLFLAISAFAAPSFAQQRNGTLEARLKAAFLYKFTEYVEWPPTAFADRGGPITIAILGASDIAAELGRAAAGRRVQGRSIAVRRVGDAAAARGAHVLFIGDAARGEIAQAARALTGPTLIVTESAGALDEGSMLNFVIVDGRVRFEAAVRPAADRGLRLSSRMLSVAMKVRSGEAAPPSRLAAPFTAAASRLAMLVPRAPQPSA